MLDASQNTPRMMYLFCSFVVKSQNTPYVAVKTRDILHSVHKIKKPRLMHLFCSFVVKSQNTPCVAVETRDIL